MHDLEIEKLGHQHLP